MLVPTADAVKTMLQLVALLLNGPSVHVPVMGVKAPWPVEVNVTTPLGATGGLPVTVSVTVTEQVDCCVGATAVGVHDTAVVVESRVTVIVNGPPLLVACWESPP